MNKTELKQTTGFNSKVINSFVETHQINLRKSTINAEYNSSSDNIKDRIVFCFMTKDGEYMLCDILLRQIIQVITEDGSYDYEYLRSSVELAPGQYVRSHQKDLFVVCDSCGRVELKSEITVAANGKSYCKRCAKAYLVECEHCHRLTDVRENKIRLVNATYECELEVNKQVVLCDNCINESGLIKLDFVEWTNYTLYGKHAYTSTDVATILKDGSAILTRDLPRIVGYYHYFSRSNYAPRSVEGEATNRYFGTEVETCGPSANVQYVYGIVDKLFHFERDGSIGQGFEMISQPMSLAYVKAHYDEIADAFTALSNAGQKSDQTDCCGLHIHVSRSAFKNEAAITKAVALVTYFQKNIEVLARRRNGSYYRYGQIEGAITKLKAERINQYGHGVAVNCENRKTVEFRVFKGTLNPKTYMATIEFVNNIVDAVNSDKKRIKFKDLLKGDFLPAYVEDRISKGYTIDFDYVIDFQAFEIDALKERLKEKRYLIQDIKRFNEASNSGVRINLTSFLGGSH